MAALVDEGMTLLMVSSDMEEILGMSDRVVVMHERRIQGVLPREGLTQERVAALMTGSAEGAEGEAGPLQRRRHPANLAPRPELDVHHHRRRHPRVVVVFDQVVHIVQEQRRVRRGAEASASPPRPFEAPPTAGAG